jgi:catechol 2,3-dioxygenase-like lactoylglutathione lyase family enzyme
VIGAERVDFVSIPVRDQDRAARFYGETLGLERDLRATHDWPEFRLGETTLAIVVPEAIGWEFAPAPPGSIAIRVPDVAEARRRLEEAGVEFTGETFDSGVCHMAFFKDPDGNGLMLHHRYAAFEDGSLP